MKNKVQKLVRGIIYDDPAIAEDIATKSATLLSAITDSIDDFNETYANSDKFDQNGNRELTPQEASTCFNILAIAFPEGIYNSDVRNLIIPSNMIDNKLYNQLSKIDIGSMIMNKYIEDRDNEASKNELEDSGQITIDRIDSTTGDVVGRWEFDNVNEAAYWVIGELEKEVIDEDQAVSILADISKINKSRE